MVTMPLVEELCCSETRFPARSNRFKVNSLTPLDGLAMDKTVCPSLSVQVVWLMALAPEPSVTVTLLWSAE